MFRRETGKSLLIHVIIVALVFAFALVVWNLLHFAPRSVAMFLPDRVCLALGAILLPFGVFSAFIAAYLKQNPEGMIGSIVIAFVGLWFLLIKPAGSGLTTEMEQLIRRVFLMMAVLMAVIIAILYLGESRLVAVANLMLIAAGFFLTTGYLRDTSRGR